MDTAPKVSEDKATGTAATAKKRKAKPTTLRIEKVTGGLLRVVNSAGGKPPPEFQGMFTEINRLQPLVDEYNKGK